MPCMLVYMRDANLGHDGMPRVPFLSLSTAQNNSSLLQQQLRQNIIREDWLVKEARAGERGGDRGERRRELGTKSVWIITLAAGHELFSFRYKSALPALMSLLSGWWLVSHQPEGMCTPAERSWGRGLQRANWRASRRAGGGELRRTEGLCNSKPPFWSSAIKKHVMGAESNKELLMKWLEIEQNDQTPQYEGKMSVCPVCGLVPDCVPHSSGLHQVFFFFLPHGCYAKTSGHTTQPDAPSMFPAQWPAAATEQGTLLPGAQTHMTIRGCLFFLLLPPQWLVTDMETTALVLQGELSTQQRSAEASQKLCG